MHRHTISSLNRLEVVDTGRRRRWSEEEKARIVLESMAGPRLVSETARRHGIARSQLLGWRRDLKGAQLGAETGFVQVVISADEPIAAPLASPVVPRSKSPGQQRIEIVLASGRRIFVDAAVDVEALGRIVEALDRR